MHYRFTTGKPSDILLVNSDPNTTEEFEKVPTYVTSLDEGELEKLMKDLEKFAKKNHSTVAGQKAEARLSSLRRQR